MVTSVSDVYSRDEEEEEDYGEDCVENSRERENEVGWEERGKSEQKKKKVMKKTKMERKESAINQQLLT